MDPALQEVTVVVPCYQEKDQILKVLSKFDPTITHIIVIDDACPEKTGEFVLKNSKDKRVQVITHETNQGVGGATITGYTKAIELGADIIVMGAYTHSRMRQLILGGVTRHVLEHSNLPLLMAH